MNTQTQPNPSIAWSIRRIPLSYGRHSPGRMVLPPVACAVEVESRLEHDVVAFLAGCPGFRFIESQPFTVRFVEREKSRRYTPDFLVVFDPIGIGLQRLGFAHWTVIEVKPAERYAHEAEAVDGRLRQVTLLTGLAAVCLTERHLGRGGRPS